MVGAGTYLATRDSTFNMQPIAIATLPANITSGHAEYCMNPWGESLLLIKIKAFVKDAQAWQVDQMLTDVGKRKLWVRETVMLRTT